MEAAEAAIREAAAAESSGPSAGICENAAGRRVAGTNVDDPSMSVGDVNQRPPISTYVCLVPPSRKMSSALFSTVEHFRETAGGWAQDQRPID